MKTIKITIEIEDVEKEKQGIFKQMDEDISRFDRQCKEYFTKVMKHAKDVVE